MKLLRGDLLWIGIDDPPTSRVELTDSNDFMDTVQMADEPDQLGVIDTQTNQPRLVLNAGIALWNSLVERRKLKDATHNLRGVRQRI